MYFTVLLIKNNKKYSTFFVIVGILRVAPERAIYSPTIRRKIMNVRCIAILLSLFVVNLPAQADPASKKLTETAIVSVKHKINPNTATLSELTGSFKGIGKKRAEAIIAYRETHNGIKSIEELAEVKGFGQHFVDANREKLKEVYEFK